MSTGILFTMLLMFALSVPIAVSIGIASVVGITSFTNLPLLLVAQQLFVSLDRYESSQKPVAAVGADRRDKLTQGDSPSPRIVSRWRHADPSGVAQPGRSLRRGAAVSGRQPAGDRGAA
jgi:hypothetical protein